MTSLKLDKDKIVSTLTTRLKVNKSDLDCLFSGAQSSYARKDYNEMSIQLQSCIMYIDNILMLESLLHTIDKEL